MTLPSTPSPPVKATVIGLSLVESLEALLADLITDTKMPTDAKIEY